MMTEAWFHIWRGGLAHLDATYYATRELAWRELVECAADEAEFRASGYLYTLHVSMDRCERLDWTDDVLREFAERDADRAARDAEARAIRHAQANT